jgi:tellurium resistance protein TerD
MFDHITTHLTQISVDWDFKGDNQKADLDVSAVVFDEMGTCLDAAYYNQLSVFGGSLTHSGDAQGDQGAEYLTLDLAHEALNIAKVIAIVVTAHNKDGTFRDVESGKIRYTAVKKDDASSKYDLNSHDLVVTSHEATAMIAAFIYRDNDNFGVWHEECWNKHIAGQNLHTFNDCIPQIVQILKDGENYLPEWAADEAVIECGKVFNMTKNSVAKISDDLSNIQVGLGWDANGIDLDSGVILMSSSGEAKKVYFAHKSEPGVKHNGDNLTGEGEGDDETIDIDLKAVDSQYDQIFITMNVYTSGTSMKDVENAFIRLVNKGGNHEELARYTIEGQSDGDAFFFARFVKAGTTWKYQAIGESYSGARSLSDNKMKNWGKNIYDKPLHVPSGAGNSSSNDGKSTKLFGFFG